jgi:hypothetical protein
MFTNLGSRAGRKRALGAPAIVGNGRFYASSYGATSGASSDQQKYIQDCINAAETYAATHGGADVVIDGEYQIEDTLRISKSDVSLVFRGGGSLIPVGSFDTIHLEHASASTWMYRNYIDRGRFDEAGKTGGRLILSKYCAHSEWDLQASGGYDGVNAESFHDITIGGRITDYTISSGGAYIRAVGPGSARSDLLKTDVTVGGDTNDNIDGLVIDGFVHTVTTDKFYAVRLRYGIVSQNMVSGAHPPSFLRLYDFQCDYPAGGGFYATAGTDIEFVSPYVHGAADTTGGGMVISNGVTQVRINGGRINGCEGHGLVLYGQEMLVCGTQIYLNGQAAANTYSGIFVGNPARDFQLIGNRSGSASQKYGCAISANADEYVVTGNNFLGNATAAILNAPGTSSTRVVDNNI